MPVEESLMSELAEAVEQSVEESKTVEETDVSTGTGAADDMGTETVVGEDGDTGTANADGNDSAKTEKGGTGSGDGESTETDTEGKSVDASPKPTISDAALTAAVQHGIPIEDARLFPNEAALGRAVQAVRKSIEQFAPKEEKQQEEEDLLAKLPVLDPEKFDPEVLALLGPVYEVIKKQQKHLKDLRSQTEQSTASAAQINQRATTQEITDWFDGQIAKLGDDFKDVLGVGGTEALSANSPQKVKRDAIANQAALLFAGYNATGTKPESRDAVFKAAAHIVLADDYAKLKEKKLSLSLDKRSRQHIQRAGGSQKAKPVGDPEAIAAAELQKMFPNITH